MSLTREQSHRLTTAIERWSAPCTIQGKHHATTPYVAGLCTPGKGVDCVRLGDSILQETYFGKWDGLEPLPREAQDAALHNIEVIARITRLLFARFDFFSVNTAGQMRAADFLVVRQKIANPGTTKAERNPHHVIIVGPDHVRCWHAVPGASVVPVGIGGVRACFDVVSVWRSRHGYAER